MPHHDSSSAAGASGICRLSVRPIDPTL